MVAWWLCVSGSGKGMRFKHRYKSCLWTRTNIWGDLLSKENTFLRPKWDSMMGILSSYRRLHRPLVNIDRYRHPLCHDYRFLKPRARPNQVFKYSRIGYRNTLSLLFSLRRFYGDLSHKAFKKFCRSSHGSTEAYQKLLGPLEGRLDMCLYRLGFFHSIYYSRQAILHNKVLVNGKKVGHGGFVLVKGDYVQFCPTEREAMRTRLVARFKRFRSATVRMERRRLSHRYKGILHMQPTPKWIHTDYPNLSFILSSELRGPVIFPFRANIDEALWAAKYGYL